MFSFQNLVNVPKCRLLIHVLKDCSAQFMPFSKRTRMSDTVARSDNLVQSGMRNPRGWTLHYVHPRGWTLEHYPNLLIS